MTAAMGRVFREKYPAPSDSDLFRPVLVRCGPLVVAGGRSRPLLFGTLDKQFAR